MSAWSQDELRKIAKTATFKGLLESGQLTPIVGRTFPLGEAAAMPYMEEGRGVRRIIITP